jgi:hypothetical protein
VQLQNNNPANYDAGIDSERELLLFADKTFSKAQIQQVSELIRIFGVAFKLCKENNTASAKPLFETGLSKLHLLKGSVRGYAEIWVAPNYAYYLFINRNFNGADLWIKKAIIALQAIEGKLKLSTGRKVHLLHNLCKIQLSKRRQLMAYEALLLILRFLSSGRPETVFRFSVTGHMEKLDRFKLFEIVFSDVVALLFKRKSVYDKRIFSIIIHPLFAAGYREAFYRPYKQWSDLNMTFTSHSPDNFLSEVRKIARRGRQPVSEVLIFQLVVRLVIRNPKKFEKAEFQQFLNSQQTVPQSLRVKYLDFLASGFK